MIDPLHAKIIAELETLSNGDKFEACANSLLREKYPHLTWVKGGNDAGFDGVAVSKDGQRIQLITTTQEDVIGNVTGSLTRAKEEGRVSDIVLVATSRNLSPERKRNIEDRIKEFGKTAYPIEDQPSFAELIYHSPRWRVELLGIPGHPPPLSRFPGSDRTYLPLLPIGRTDELKRLTNEGGDLVVFGQPGSGKTHLLAHVAKTTDGLFLAATDQAAITDGIREQSPKWIVVDDAFSRLDLLLLLRRIRHDTGAVFRIVAACWPGQQDDVAAALDTLGKQPLEVPQLPQSDIKDIITAAGIYGPDSLLWELIHQADGKPGLAVTLARLCAQENVRDVVAGRALARDVKHTLTLMAGKEAVALLGHFALAGNKGLDVASAAKATGFPPPTVRQLVETMGAAGVLQVVEKNRLAVEPARLRQALVAETFCQPGVSLEWQPLLELIPDRSEAVVTVICAGLLGGKLDDAQIQREIVHLANNGRDFAQACECYARLGRHQSLWVLETFPQLLEKIADELLVFAPRETLPLLIRADHKIRAGIINARDRLKPIKKWIDAVAQKTETASRRALLLDALVSLGDELKASSTLLAGLAHVFSLRFEWVSTPPGQASVMTFSNGAVRFECLPAIAAFWEKSLALLTNLPAVQTVSLHEIIADWVFPRGRLSIQAPAEYLECCQKFGAAMLSDLLKAYAGNWAVLRRFDRMASAVGVALPPTTDTVAKTLFPPRSKAGELEVEQEYEAAAKALAATWTLVGPKKDIIHQWLARDAEASEAGVNYPNLGENIVAYQIAETTKQSDDWFAALLAEHAPARLLYPFAIVACRNDETVLTTFVEKFIEDATYGGLAADCLLRFSQPSRPAWVAASKSLSRYADSIGTAVLRDQLSEEVILWLLENGNTAVRSEVAANLWSAKPKGEIPAALRPAWRMAVIEDMEDDYQWDEIAKLFPDLACAWLKKRINQTYEDRVNGQDDFTMHHHLPAIIDALSIEQRREVIDTFTEENYHSEILAQLVGGNLDLMRHALARPATKRLVQSCLGSPSDSPNGWADRAIVLFNDGLNPQEVFWASQHGAEGWTGPESNHYESRRAAYEPFANHPDLRVQELCKLAEAYFAGIRDEARTRERAAAIKGRLI